MLPQFSRAGNFEPKFYTGGGMRFYLPLLHDIMALEKPALVVIPEVTRAAVLIAAPELVRQSFFDHIKPLHAVHANGTPSVTR